MPEALRALLEGAPDSEIIARANDDNKTEAARLRAQMQADALQPLDDDLSGLGPPKRNRDEPGSTGQSRPSTKMAFDDDTLQDTRDWLQLGVRMLLHRCWNCY